GSPSRHSLPRASPLWTSLPCASPPSSQTSPHHRPGKEPSAAWFQGGKEEAMKVGFDDAADKADSMAMYEAGLVSPRENKIVDRSNAKREALQSIFDNVTEIECSGSSSSSGRRRRRSGTSGEGAMGLLMKNPRSADGARSM
uniref:Uncharacterized protein n=1 Tax=Oryza glaberrima TaxID=4538 RepID=I1R5P7_ORYGL